MNINLKIYKAILKGLNEALTNLSTDDFNGIDIPVEDIEYLDIDNHNGYSEHLEWLAKKFLIKKFKENDKSPLADEDLLVIEEINNNPHRYISLIKVDAGKVISFTRRAIEILGDNANLNWIDVSDITDMSNLFAFSKFDGDISMWDVSNVENMMNMFEYSEFNGDISNWNVSNVRAMNSMFRHSKFNGDISKWEVSKVLGMAYMFDSSMFDRDLSKWNVSNVGNMRDMFKKSLFNGDISLWDVSSVTDMSRMFADSQFDQNISKWNIGNVKDYGAMFYKCPIHIEYRPNKI